MEEISRQNVSVWPSKQLGSIRFDWATAQMIERYRLVLNDRVYPVGIE
jgi:hypothetical protein